MLSTTSFTPLMTSEWQGTTAPAARGGVFKTRASGPAAGSSASGCAGTGEDFARDMPRNGAATGVSDTQGVACNLAAGLDDVELDARVERAEVELAARGVAREDGRIDAEPRLRGENGRRGLRKLTPRTACHG